MTKPAVDQEQDNPAPTIVLTPYYRDEVTGETWVHQDYQKIAGAFEHEGHISPVEVTEKLGDVHSWVAYVQRFGSIDSAKVPLITWNQKGLSAVLDYPDRRKWHAVMPFVLTPEFVLWSDAGRDQAIPLAKVVEFLDNRAPEIAEPAAADLLAFLRKLKANVNSGSEVVLRPDGTSALRFAKDTRITGDNDVDLPPEITIAIPVLRGHVDEDGAPVRYKLVLKLRASAGDNAQVSLRMLMPQKEVVLEQVYAERVTEAEALLGDGYPVLRAAD